MWGDACGDVWGRKGEPIPIPVLHQKERHTYYGVIHYLTKEFILKPYDKGDGLNTVNVIQFLRHPFRGSRWLFIWEGASDHKYAETQDDLNEINAGLEKKWPVECFLLAPNAPDQNPVEDIWLQIKNHIRKNFMECDTFLQVKSLFESFGSGKVFDFSKMNMYGEFV